MEFGNWKKKKKKKSSSWFLILSHLTAFDPRVFPVPQLQFNFVRTRFQSQSLSSPQHWVPVFFWIPFPWGHFSSWKQPLLYCFDSLWYWVYRFNCLDLHWTTEPTPNLPQPHHSTSFPASVLCWCESLVLFQSVLYGGSWVRFVTTNQESAT